MNHCEKPLVKEWPVVIKDRGEPEGRSGTIKRGEDVSKRGGWHTVVRAAAR